jgi:hypothetical protein
MSVSFPTKCFICHEFIQLSFRNIQVFFENHAQNLNPPQNNSASWDLQMGFNSAFKWLWAINRVNGHAVFVSLTDSSNNLKKSITFGNVGTQPRIQEDPKI